MILQLLTTQHVGDTIWQDLQSGTSYSNVVSYANTCAIAMLTKGNMDTLYVRIENATENIIDEGCFQCLSLFTDPPKTKVDFKEISKSPCLVQPNY